MESSIVITTHSFVYDYIKNSVSGQFTKVHPKSLFTLKDETFNYVFYDVGKDSQLSLEVISKLKSRSNFMIFLTPSNDKQILRTFPFYLFDATVDYPFNKEKLLKHIKTTSAEFKRTRELVSAYTEQQYKEVIDIANMEVNNEKELLCIYHSLLESKQLTEAEEIRKSFYDSEKLPCHPEIKLINSMFYSNNIDSILDSIKNNPSYYCNSIQDQISLHSIGCYLNNEHRNAIDDTLGRSILYLHDVVSVLEALNKHEIFEGASEAEIKRFIYKRDFDVFFSSSPLTQSIIISLAYNLLDINALKFLSTKEFKLPPFITTLLKKMIDEKIAIKRLPEKLFSSDFDNIANHVNFLRGYKKLRYLSNKDSILSSVFLISLRDRKNQIKPMIKSLGDFYMENDVYSTYQAGESLKKELLRLEFTS